MPEGPLLYKQRKISYFKSEERIIDCKTTLICHRSSTVDNMKSDVLSTNIDRLAPPTAFSSRRNSLRSSNASSTNSVNTVASSNDNVGLLTKKVSFRQNKTKKSSSGSNIPQNNNNNNVNNKKDSRSNSLIKDYYTANQSVDSDQNRVQCGTEIEDEFQAFQRRTSQIPVSMSSPAISAHSRRTSRVPINRSQSQRDPHATAGFGKYKPKRSASFRDACHLRGDESFQVLMLGAVGVGKSSLVKQFHTSNVDHLRLQISTVYGNCDGTISEKAQLTIVDNPAAEITAEMAIACCDVDAYVVVYSVVERDSFRTAQQIVKALASDEASNSKAIILVGNKVDLVRLRTVSSDEGKSCAANFGCKFVETSDWIDYNVDRLFEVVLTEIRNKTRKNKEANAASGSKTNGKTRKYRRSKTLGAKSWGVLKDLINRFNRKVRSYNDLQDL